MSLNGSAVLPSNTPQQPTHGVTLEGRRGICEPAPVMKSQTDAQVSWPSLSLIGLTEQEKAERLLGIGGSDANVIMSGDGDRITSLWLEKRGAPAEDLSDRLQVALGAWTEPFNRQWYEKISGDTVE